MGWAVRIARRRQGAQRRFWIAASYHTAASTAVMKANAAQIDRSSTLMAVVTMGSPMSFGERDQEKEVALNRAKSHPAMSSSSKR
jgi:hypothetical protein